MSHRDPPYQPPSVSVLQELQLKDRPPTGHVNQVWPNLYISNEVTASDKATLHHLGITHIVNAADRAPHHSQWPRLIVRPGPRFDRDMSVDYFGVEGIDAVDFMLSPFFCPTAQYINRDLQANRGGFGRVLVHCLMCVTRSATLICEDLSLREAMAAVRTHRHLS
ncbi:dual specificity protein phosphatase 13B [Entelurus aequoreus]|uniref:dual specificity protein phosphatase 13B n=1 Tax=Entelurus aequoreus TaxID=161455 RepID=UPI002B1E8C66|nr:dual specificity protein phosphatase 13B [Entelurus aequoreus]